MAPLAHRLAALAHESMAIQRQLDEAWTSQVHQLKADFEAAGLSQLPLGQALEERVRPQRQFVSAFEVTLHSDIVQTARRHGGIEIRPLNAGYRAAFGIDDQAHCQIQLEIRQTPVSPPSAISSTPTLSPI